jgi:hypothetical protein
MKKFFLGGLLFSLLIFSGCALKKDLPPAVNNEPSAAGNESRLLAQEAFSLEAPANWKESPSLPGVSLMMVNSTETSERPEVKKINFRSYFSISYATLKEKNLAEYTAYLKDQLTRMVSGITFQDLESAVIDGRPAHVFSADLNQQGVDFKLLMFVAAGENKDVWLISFNTLAENLSGYEDLFFQVAESFRAK